MALARKRSFQIALVMKIKGAYGRDIVAGVCDYVKTTNVSWDLLSHEDFRCQSETILGWPGDGAIVDFDEPEFEGVFTRARFPVVAVGGSYSRDADYPQKLPYVATDNVGLVAQAYEHLVDMGLRHFALYSMPPAGPNRWAQEREKAYSKLCKRDGLSPMIFHGVSTYAPDWEMILGELQTWLRSLPKPVGVIAVTDARARQVLQACVVGEFAVPEQVALVGIDDDPTFNMFTRIPISSVRQGTHEIGRTAAALLHRRLSGEVLGPVRVQVPPDGVIARVSSRHQPTHDPYIMRARHYIRQFGLLGIKVGQVAEYVGVSRTTLDTRFQKAFGGTVHDEILQFRLQAAQSALKEGTTNCDEIAVRTGFGSSQYMNRVFRRELGCSPREYMRRR